MTAIAFVKRASVETAAVLSAVAVGASLLFGSAVGIGVVAGGALAIANLWWLARRVVAATDVPAPGWSLGAMLRLAGVAGVVALVLTSGFAHPVGVVAGLTVLPFVLVARGLAAAREA